MLEITVTRSKNLQPKPADESALGFGRLFTDHMFLMDYEAGVGWKDARIVPYGDFFKKVRTFAVQKKRKDF